MLENSAGRNKCTIISLCSQFFNTFNFKEFFNTFNFKELQQLIKPLRFGLLMNKLLALQ